jgi:hypothetical protein
VNEKCNSPAVSNRARYETAPELAWQTPIPPCALCGSKRREYLFVIGQTRVLKCPECGLASRDETPTLSRSYALDDATRRYARARLGAARRILQVTMGGASDARLGDVEGVSFTNVDVARDPGALAKLEAGGFDAAFVNGVVDQTPDFLPLLRTIRARLVPRGVIVLLVGGDVSLVQSDASIQHVFTPAPLIRAAITSGLRPRECGLVMRAVGETPADERLPRHAPLGRVHRVLAALGVPTEVSTGLLALVATAEDMPARPKLSIIMPVFNEARTFKDTFDRVYAAKVRGVDREILVIESNSTDGSRELVQAIEHLPDVRVIWEDRPQGKGHAVRAALAQSTGDLLLVQDADSEYDVTDYDIVIEPLLRLTATFVLGSRHLGRRTWKIREFSDSKSLSLVMNMAHEFFTVLANELYESDMRDPTTMYKVFRREAYEGVALRRDRFDFDWELVCKLIRHGHVPVEVPVNYRSRSYAEGKKVRFFRDPLTWVTTIVSSRFERVTAEPGGR